MPGPNPYMASDMPIQLDQPPTLHPGKFSDPLRTLRGEPRAQVAFGGLRTLWVNTGTLCNITCASCYIESSPRNDALVYFSVAELRAFLDEAQARGEPLEEVGFTGGEPFMNRDLPAMLEEVLGRGLRALVLTNGMKPMRQYEAALLRLRGERLTLRVSLDHFDAAIHDAERGAGSFAIAIDGLSWLSEQGFRTHVAGRAGFASPPGTGDAAMRAGFHAIFAAHGIHISADDPVALMLFPEMDARRDVPEITEACWGILGKSPDSLMCASARMVVKRRGAAAPAVLACTLLAYDARFELGGTLAEAARPLALNHPNCATFCVLGGGACSR